jgi:hypothetical protein
VVGAAEAVRAVDDRGMKLPRWLQRAHRHDPKQHAAAQQRLQRLITGFEGELASLQLPQDSAEPGQMPEILSRPRVDDGASAADSKLYPWEQQPEPEAPVEPRRRRY